MRRHDNEPDRLCATKQGRPQCVDAVRAIAARHGATVELHEFTGPREIGLELILAHYACMMHFDGGEHLGAFLGHWHMNRAAPRDDRRTYPDTFWRVGSLNTFHRQKATTISYTLADFMQKLEDGLSLLRATERLESWAS